MQLELGAKRVILERGRKTQYIFVLPILKHENIKPSIIFRHSRALVILLMSVLIQGFMFLFSVNRTPGLRIK